MDAEADESNTCFKKDNSLNIIKYSSFDDEILWDTHAKYQNLLFRYISSKSEPSHFLQQLKDEVSIDIKLQVLFKINLSTGAESVAEYMINMAIKVKGEVYF